MLIPKAKPPLRVQDGSLKAEGCSVSAVSPALGEQGPSCPSAGPGGLPP